MQRLPLLSLFILDPRKLSKAHSRGLVFISMQLITANWTLKRPSYQSSEGLPRLSDDSVLVVLNYIGNDCAPRYSMVRSPFLDFSIDEFFT